MCLARGIPYCCPPPPPPPRRPGVNRSRNNFLVSALFLSKSYACIRGWGDILYLWGDGDDEDIGDARYNIALPEAMAVAFEIGVLPSLQERVAMGLGGVKSLLASGGFSFVTPSGEDHDNEAVFTPVAAGVTGEGGRGIDIL